MHLEYVPLLQVQRDLYAIPRGMERFHAYLKTMVDSETGDLKLPLGAMNPLGKEHVVARLDAYLALYADTRAAQALSEALPHLAHTPGAFKVTLVISDDAAGGWTNRSCNDFSHCFETQPYDKRGWLTAMLWTSEAPSAQAVRAEVLATVYRSAYIQQHGYARTLRAMLTQEGSALAQAGCTEPTLDAEELAYAREVIAPHLDTNDYPTIMACLFGDKAAYTLGYQPVGLSPRAGFALALSQARTTL